MYCSIDPSTAILEVAVHKGFRALDTVAHVLTAITIATPASAHVVERRDVPDANWLRPGVPSQDQQRWGDALLAGHSFVLLPSVVSSNSWNLIFAGTRFGADYAAVQEPFALDPRLHPSTAG